MSIDHGGQIDANGSAYSIANHQCTPVISRQTSLLQPDLKGHRTTELTSPALEPRAPVELMTKVGLQAKTDSRV